MEEWERAGPTIDSPTLDDNRTLSTIRVGSLIKIPGEFIQNVQEKMAREER